MDSFVNPLLTQELAVINSSDSAESSPDSCLKVVSQ